VPTGRVADGDAEPRTQKAERPRKGAAPKYRGLEVSRLNTANFLHLTEPGQARKCATGKCVPSSGQRGLGMTEEHLDYAH
jgi:hypothetical protein